MSVKVVNSGSGTIKVNAETTPAIKVESPEVSVVNVNPVYTSGQPGPTGPAGPAGTDGADADLNDVVAVYETVFNDSGGTLNKATPVTITIEEDDQGNPKVVAARADTPSLMPAHFILNEQIADQATGQAILVGMISGVNTSGLSTGDELYVAPSGGYTGVKPAGTNLIQKIAVVSHIDAANGTGYVTGAARANDVPNIPDGQVWIGNSSGVATPTALNSLVIDSLVIKNDAQTQTITDGDATVNFVEGTGVNVSVTDGGSGEVDVTISGEDASYANKGVARFDSDDFTVTDGVVSLIDGLGTVLYDKAPQLGGDLDVNGQDIVSRNSGDIVLQPDGTGVVRLGNYTFDVGQTVTGSEDDYVLTYDHTSRTISLEASSGGLNNVVDDNTPQLGGDLDVNGQSVVSVSNGDITIVPDGTGKVGIGTTTPDEKLHIDNGNIQVGAIEPNATNREVTITGYDAAKLKFDLHSGFGRPEFSANFSGIVKLTNQGSSSTLATLQIGESASREGAIRMFSNEENAIQIGNNAGYSVVSMGIVEAGNNYTGGLKIKTRSGTSTTSDFFFSKDGELGIGTTSPNEKLHVDGNIVVGGQANIDKISVTKGTGITSAGDFGVGSRVLNKFGSNVTGLTAGDVYYFGSSSWAQADADAASSASGMLAVATDTTSTNGMLKEGLVKMADSTGFSSASAGDILYLSTAAGHVTVTAPSQNGDIVRVVGYVFEPSNGIIYFDPSNDWIEITA